jgi:hypothetical protein
VQWVVWLVGLQTVVIFFLKSSYEFSFIYFTWTWKSNWPSRRRRLATTAQMFWRCGGREGWCWAALLLVAHSRRSPCHPRGDLLARRAGGTKSRVRRSVVLLLSTILGLLRVCLESCQGGAFRLAVARSRMSGRRPWMAGTLWVGGRAWGSSAC